MLLLDLLQVLLDTLPILVDLAEPIVLLLQEHLMSGQFLLHVVQRDTQRFALLTNFLRTRVRVSEGGNETRGNRLLSVRCRLHAVEDSIAPRVAVNVF